MLIILEIVALIATGIGALLIARKKRAGWLVFLIGSPAWISLYIMKGLYLILLAQIYFIIINIIGWVNWSKGSK